MNGLCKKAISVGLEAGYTVMDILNKFLEDFIHKHSMNQHMSTNVNQDNTMYDNELDNLHDKENEIPFDVLTVHDPITKK
ncbi:hypothetical protein F8M41_001556 [Gigaspora margarita]|uniref:Uncharacterized protein n=1 Tax=Gigaspora margarita TaxID=4874 RepID=A0A8H4A9Y3_GIGMA|nr:hypothetical protein F8M41_001556 [Gigaspora margarita]